MPLYGQKLPAPIIVNRMYWIDEMPVAAIAQTFNASTTAVYAYMRRHRIPRKKVGWNGKSRRSTCVEKNCGKPVCRQKRWKNGKPYWVWTCRCTDCFKALMRLNSRIFAERRRRRLGMRMYRRRVAPVD